MRTKKSAFGAYLIALKVRFGKRLSNAGGVISPSSEPVVQVHKDMTRDTPQDNVRKGMLSDMGNKLCLSKWSAFK